MKKEVIIINNDDVSQKRLQKSHTLLYLLPTHKLFVPLRPTLDNDQRNKLFVVILLLRLSSNCDEFPDSRKSSILIKFALDIILLLPFIYRILPNNPCLEISKY